MTLDTQEIAWLSEDGLSALYCGDAFNLMSEISDNSIDCIWTDPPYLLSNDGITCVAGKMVSVNKGAWDRSNGIEKDHEFNLSWLSECHRILKPTGTIWVTGTLHIYLSVGMAMMQLGFRILNDIVWEKNNPPPNLGCRCFTHSTETVLWATKAPKGSKHKYTFNYNVMKEENGGKQMKTVWRIPAAGKDEKLHGKHPTQKPVALIERCIRASTNPGDLVFDPFAGTAATGVAALTLGRYFNGIEKDIDFARIGRQRLEECACIQVGNGASVETETPISQKRLLESAASYTNEPVELDLRLSNVSSP
ncbi:MAG: site-specific DNA-methyltransferase [Chloroflexi bacterium]|nr:site-specific DNA-methyltransferase [Chloroflexota bacterium]